MTPSPVSTVEEKETKPCPVCGGEMVLHDNDWADPPLWRQVCAGCGLSTGESATRALAIERGNRRATIPVERGMRDILRELLDADEAVLTFIIANNFTQGLRESEWKSQYEELAMRRRKAAARAHALLQSPARGEPK